MTKLLLILGAICISTSPFLILTTYKIKNPNDKTQDITTIENDLQTILNQRNDQPWTQTDLQTEVTTRFQGIVVAQVNTRAFETNKHSDQRNFKGNGSMENDLPYKGEITLTHKWTKTTDKTQDITTIENDLQTILNQRNDKAWTKEELEKEIVDQGIDIEGGIIVEEVINSTKVDGKMKICW